MGPVPPPHICVLNISLHSPHVLVTCRLFLIGTFRNTTLFPRIFPRPPFWPPSPFLSLALVKRWSGPWSWRPPFHPTREIPIFFGGDRVVLLSLQEARAPLYRCFHLSFLSLILPLSMIQVAQMVWRFPLPFEFLAAGVVSRRICGVSNHSRGWAGRSRSMICAPLLLPGCV